MMHRMMLAFVLIGAAVAADAPDWRKADLKDVAFEFRLVQDVNEIERPLLIGQGANDPRVTQIESDQIVEAMQRHNIPVTYVLFRDEGHGFRRPENNMSFFAVTEAFLGECLGGRVQPIGDDFDGSSIQVLHGAEHVAGLAEAIGAGEEEGEETAEEEAAE